MNGYALGLETRDYRGKLLLTHTGGLPGYVSRVAMIPELRLGVVVLTNQESGLAFNAIAYRVLDHYLGVKAPDYVGIYRAGPGAESGPAGASWPPRPRVSATRPPGRRSRSSDTRAPTATSGMATLRSRRRTAAWSFA